MTKTRQEAIANQKNPAIRARLEAMTDEQYAAHNAKFRACVASGSVAASVKRMAASVR